MTWKKSSEELVEKFHEAMESFEGLEKRKMFGYPCCFINGNMFSGLHEENWIVRLAEKDREEIMGQYGVSLFDPMGGRPMKEYVALPKEILEDQEKLDLWLKRSYYFVSVLPPKVKKPKKAKASR